MIVAYWIVAGFLALMYLYSGFMKVAWSQERLRPMMGWVDSMPLGYVRTIGVLEVLGALGLILPPLIGIATWLALAAAIGFLLVQIGAIILHLSRDEARLIGLNIGMLIAGVALIWLSTAWL